MQVFMTTLEKGFPRCFLPFFSVLYVDLVRESPSVTIILYECGALAHECLFVNVFHTTLLAYWCFFVLKYVN